VQNVDLIIKDIAWLITVDPHKGGSISLMPSKRITVRRDVRDLT
jgi:hypothetical protein